jgi:hypothetical protein
MIMADQAVKQSEVPSKSSSWKESVQRQEAQVQMKAWAA